VHTMNTARALTRRRARLPVLGIASIVLCSAVAVAAQAPPSPPNQLSVSGGLRVIEADTLEVWVEGARLAVGVIGIKAPPGNTPCGREAIAVAARMVADSVLLDTDPRLPLFDKRFRRLYRVTTADGRSLATELVYAGLATAEPSDAAALDYSDIVAAQTDARSVQRGCVWSGDSNRTR
jgi:endonuclease YncB( thermonuclease family)